MATSFNLNKAKPSSTRTSRRCWRCGSLSLPMPMVLSPRKASTNYSLSTSPIRSLARRQRRPSLLRFQCRPWQPLLVIPAISRL